MYFKSEIWHFDVTERMDILSPLQQQEVIIIIIIIFIYLPSDVISQEKKKLQLPLGLLTLYTILEVD